MGSAVFESGPGCIVGFPPLGWRDSDVMGGVEAGMVPQESTS